MHSFLNGSLEEEVFMFQWEGFVKSGKEGKCVNYTIQFMDSNRHLGSGISKPLK
jgi:hypothetical protein